MAKQSKREDNPVIVEDSGSTLRPRAKKTDISHDSLNAKGRTVFEAGRTVTGFDITGTSPIGSGGESWIMTISENNPPDQLNQLIIFSMDNKTIQIAPILADYDDSLQKKHHAKGLAMRHIQLQVGANSHSIALAAQSKVTVHYVK